VIPPNPLGSAQQELLLEAALLVERTPLDVGEMSRTGRDEAILTTHAFP